MIVSINWQGVEQIATYAEKLLFIFKSVSLLPTIVVPQTDIGLINQFFEFAKVEHTRIT